MRCCRGRCALPSRSWAAQARIVKRNRVSADGPSDAVWDAESSRDRRRETSVVEAAIGTALGRNVRLRGSHITVTAGAEGLVTLTGTVPTQALRREIELSCWMVSGVWTLHDQLVVGR